MPYIPPTTHVNFHATIRRERVLPTAGEILVSANQTVEASTIVAQTILAEEHRLMTVAQTLGVPPDKLDTVMVKKDGDPVKKNEPIAVRKTAFGLGTKMVRSDVDGMLVLSGEGKALLAAFSKPLELQAGVPGTVTNVVEGLGVIIETTGGVAQGIWGNGKSRYAVLSTLGDGPDVPIALEHLDPKMRDTIAVGGALLDTKAFKKMVEVGLRGLIVGSVSSDLLPALQKLAFPVLVLDTFGARGMSHAAYNLLTNNAGREAWVDARPADRAAGTRPEVIVPLPSPGSPPPLLVEGDILDVGRRARIVRGPYAGQTGEVVSLPEKSVVLPSGLRVKLAALTLETPPNETVTAPFANLELVG